MPKIKLATQFLAVDQQSPPTEFRIFKRGWNATEKGDFLFDDIAALSVMSAYRKHGIDRAIDLEHLSIDQESKSYDPDARGWFKLAMRDGELWAIDVRWTPDGERRLREATQRYISPFFAYGEKSRRVQSLHNVAIVATPATDETPALVAASMRAGLKLSNEADDMDKICTALGLKEDASVEEILGAIKALAEDDGGDDGKGALLKKLAAKLKLKDDASEDDVMSALGDSDKDEEKKGELAALRSNNVQLQARLSALESKSVKSEVQRLVEENTDKIPKHLEEWALEQSPMALNAFLKVAISQPRPKEPKGNEGGGNGGEVVLTPEEKKLARLSGMTEEVALKGKKDRFKREQAQREQQD